LDSFALTPPPLPLQPVSEIDRSVFRFRVVPPTAMTLGDAKGQITPAPLSPEDEKKLTPLVDVKWMSYVVFSQELTGARRFYNQFSLILDTYN